MKKVIIGLLLCFSVLSFEAEKDNSQNELYRTFCGVTAHMSNVSEAIEEGTYEEILNEHVRSEVKNVRICWAPKEYYHCKKAFISNGADGETRVLVYSPSWGEIYEGAQIGICN